MPLVPSQIPWAGPRCDGMRQVEVELGGRWFRLTEGSGREGLWLWPAAVMLARRVAELDWRGKTFLDLGAGLGLLGMAAASRGAFACFLDRDPAACERLRGTLAFNGLTGAVLCDDWQAFDAGPFDAVVASEVAYPGYGLPLLARFLARRLGEGASRAWVVTGTRQHDPAWEEALTEHGLALRRPLATLAVPHPHGGEAEAWLWDLVPEPGRE